MTSPRRIKVLVVDDSAVVRRVVSDCLREDPSIEVVGSAGDPYAAKSRIEELSPDVITLDLEMPRMDGLTFLRILMRERPLPVVVMSSLTNAGSTHALEALRLGAVEVLGKPNAYSIGDVGPRLQLAIKAAARARLRRQEAPTLGTSPAVPPSAETNRILVTPQTAPHPERLSTPPGTVDPRRLILLGASTGGTEALREVLVRLPDGLPPIAIVQHIPATFSKAFADRMNTMCAFKVREAVDGEILTPGLALVAPGNFHLLLRWTGTGHRVELSTGPQVWHQRPAVDILFKSIPEITAPRAIAGVLTGMGKDGAEGLLRLRRAGSSTFAQDEATSVVYGMPREAWEQGGAERQLPIEGIAEHIVRLCHNTPAANARS